MTKIRTYRNKRNPNKFIEVHNDGHYHNSVKQYMYWEAKQISRNRAQLPCTRRQLYVWQSTTKLKL